MEFWAVLRRPERFFDRLDRKVRGLRTALIFSACLSAGHFAYWQAIRLAPPPPYTGFALEWVFAAGLLLNLAGWAVAWLVLGGVVYLLADGEERAWSIVGWAAAPLALIAPLALGFALLFPVDFSSLAHSGQAQATWAAQVREAVRASPYFHFSETLMAGAAVWSAWLVAVALRLYRPHRVQFVTVGYLLAWALLIFWGVP